MEKELNQIREEALCAVNEAKDLESLQNVSVKYIGRKGSLTLMLRNVANLPADQKPLAGKLTNILKKEIEEAVEKATEKIEADIARNAPGIDITLPGRPAYQGNLHPITKVTEEICSIFLRLGFEIAEGPEVESDYYNFEALNIPKNHPARDMQDTFYVSGDVVLRTHTSPMQARVMEKSKPPIRIIAPGKVYRCDSDNTHTPMFNQVEGLLVDENISFSDLKGILTIFVHQIFDKNVKLRFRPSFFPFTEPSAEVDIECVMCRGKGCRVCSQTGWLEILGSGMVHPYVFEKAGYEPGKYSGFAFGTGVERIAMLKYGIDDLRKFYENDIRFLGQF